MERKELTTKVNNTPQNVTEKVDVSSIEWEMTHFRGFEVLYGKDDLGNHYIADRTAGHIFVVTNREVRKIFRGIEIPENLLSCLKCGTEANHKEVEYHERGGSIPITSISTLLIPYCPVCHGEEGQRVPKKVQGSFSYPPSLGYEQT